jgi:hypothetical protein
MNPVSVQLHTVIIGTSAVHECARPFGPTTNVTGSVETGAGLTSPAVWAALLSLLAQVGHRPM